MPLRQGKWSYACIPQHSEKGQVESTVEEGVIFFLFRLLCLLCLRVHTHRSDKKVTLRLKNHNGNINTSTTYRSLGRKVQEERTVKTTTSKQLRGTSIVASEATVREPGLSMSDERSPQEQIH
jgi:hypothetical protein